MHLYEVERFPHLAFRWCAKTATDTELQVRFFYFEAMNEPKCYCFPDMYKSRGLNVMHVVVVAVRRTRGHPAVLRVFVRINYCPLPPLSLVSPLTYPTKLLRLHNVPSSIYFHLCPKLRYNLCSCFEGLQKADEERHCLPSLSRPARVLSHSRWHPHRTSNSSPDI